MIAKRILRKGNSSFKRLSDYITDAKRQTDKQATDLKDWTGEEAEIWERTVDYILNAANAPQCLSDCGQINNAPRCLSDRGQIKGSERVGAIRITNCLTTDVGFAVQEIIATQSRNTRAKGNRTYHMVVSFPPGETPNDEQLRDIEDELAAAIGLSEHQRISAVHTDTDHLHVHVAINQIHPQKLTLIEPYYDKLKLMGACERLEIKHGLIRTYHGEDKRKNKTTGERRPEGRAEAMDTHGAGPSLLGWIHREVRPVLLDTLKNAGDWQDLHQTLAGYGLVLRRRGAGLVIADISNGRVTVKASSVDRVLGLQALEKQFGAFVRPDAEFLEKADKAQRTYRRTKVHRHKDMNQLFEEWETLRAERRKPFDAVEAMVRSRIDQTKESGRALIDRIRGNGANVQSAKEDQHRRNQKWLREVEEWAETERAKARAANPPVPSWRDYLREAAECGNRAALRSFKRNNAEWRLAINALMGRDNSDAALAALRKEFHIWTKHNGDTVYCTRDGGEVVLHGRVSHVERASPTAWMVATALPARIASDGKGVRIASDWAREGMIEAAARERLDIEFDNPADEHERRRRLRVYERRDAKMAAAVFVAAHNEDQPEEPAYRLWQDGDGGQAVFVGVAHLEDDVENAAAVLVRKDDEIIVAPLTRDEAALLGDYNQGDTVTLTAEGLVASEQQGMQR